MYSPPIDFAVCHTFKHPRNPSRGREGTVHAVFSWVSHNSWLPTLLPWPPRPCLAAPAGTPPPPPISRKTAALHLCATHLYNILQSSPIRTDGRTTFTHCDAYSDDDWPLPKLSPIKSWCTYARRFSRRVAGEVS